MKIAAAWVVSFIIACPLIILTIYRPTDVLSAQLQCAIFNSYFLVGPWSSSHRSGWKFFRPDLPRPQSNRSDFSTFTHHNHILLFFIFYSFFSFSRFHRSSFSLSCPFFSSFPRCLFTVSSFPIYHCNITDYCIISCKIISSLSSSYSSSSSRLIYILFLCPDLCDHQLVCNTYSTRTSSSTVRWRRSSVHWSSWWMILLSSCHHGGWSAGHHGRHVHADHQTAVAPSTSAGTQRQASRNEAQLHPAQVPRRFCFHRRQLVS